MKRKFIITELAALCLALAALTGCNKKETSPVTGPVISFNAEDAFTKAVVTGVTDIQNDPAGIRVWDWHTSLAYPDGTHTFDAAGTQVTYSDGAWSYSPARYWLNGIYSFAAVYPWTVSGATYEAVSGGAPVLTVPAFDVTTQNDLLVAINNGPDGSGINGLTHPDYVTLDFKHVLTRINFRITQSEKDEINDYYVTKVELTGVKNKRTYSATPNLDEAGNVTSLTEVWNPSNQGNEETISFAKDFDSIHLKGENGGIIELTAWGEDGLLLIPQEIDGQMKIRVYYRYDLSGDADGNGTATYSDIIIPDYPDYPWQSGKRITYIVPLAHQMDIVIGVPTIEPWKSPQQGGTVIIK